MKDLLPIDSIHIFKRDIVVKRIGEPVPEWCKPRKRGEIAEFTWNSRRNLAFTAANTDVSFRTMITLTYPASWPLDGRESKRHLAAFLQFLRRVDGDVDYLWFLEFQRRGAPHYHLLVSTPVWSFDRGHVSRRWYTIVGKLSDNHLLAGTRVEKLRSPEGGSRYAVKYALKMSQKMVPHAYQNCGRFWGCSGRVRPRLRGVASRISQDDLTLYLMRWHKGKGKRLDYKILFGASPFLRDAVGWGDSEG